VQGQRLKRRTDAFWKLFDALEEHGLSKPKALAALKHNLLCQSDVSRTVRVGGMFSGQAPPPVSSSSSELPLPLPPPPPPPLSSLSSSSSFGNNPAQVFDPDLMEQPELVPELVRSLTDAHAKRRFQPLPYKPLTYLVADLMLWGALPPCPKCGNNTLASSRRHHLLVQ
jgi:hypothetical protein